MNIHFYAKEGELKEHSNGPYIVDGCIAIHVNDYMQAVGLGVDEAEGEEIFDRLIDYSEWLEDRFDRGLDSTEAISCAFLEEYGEDLEPDDVLQALEELRSDLLRVMSGLELAISKIKGGEHRST